MANDGGQCYSFPAGQPAGSHHGNVDAVPPIPANRMVDDERARDDDLLTSYGVLLRDAHPKCSDQELQFQNDMARRDCTFLRECLTLPCIILFRVCGILCRQCCRKSPHRLSYKAEAIITVLHTALSAKRLAVVRAITNPPFGAIPLFAPFLPSSVGCSVNRIAPHHGEWFFPSLGSRSSCYCQTPDGDPQLWPNIAEVEKIIVYLHGGGFCLGSPKIYRDLCMRLVAATGAVVLGTATTAFVSLSPLPAQ
jgi:hypothetical protein